MTDNYDIIKDFLIPTEIVVEEQSNTRTKIFLEPLEQGFGHTLGNALRGLCYLQCLVQQLQKLK